MISDTLHDAAAELRRYLADFPRAYADRRPAIERLVADMDTIRLDLDRPPLVRQLAGQVIALPAARPSTLRAVPGPAMVVGHLALNDDKLLLVNIPESDAGEQPAFGIAPGWHDVVELLRAHKGNADAVQFIADMIEV